MYFFNRKTWGKNVKLLAFEIINIGMQRVRTDTRPHGSGEDWRAQGSVKMKGCHPLTTPKEKCYSHRVYPTR